MKDQARIVKAQMAAPNAIAYIAAHMGGPPEGLAAPLRPDFGASEPPPPEDTVDVEGIRTRCTQIRELVARAQADRCEWGATKAIYQQSMAKIMDRDIGPIKDVADQIEELLGKAEGPVDPPPPPPTQYDSFGGTYGPEHGMAFDWYPNGEDGPHFGYQFKCPAAGAVTRYSFGPGPLGVQCQIDDGFTGDTYDAGDLTGQFVANMLTPAQVDAITTLGTYMHIAVETFDQPQRTPGGYTARAIWIGHTQDGFATGRRNTGDDFAKCGRSGVEFAGCDASHGHVCGTATGTLSPNGDISGLEVVRLLGGNPRVTRVPGPSDYMTGRADKGKFR